MNEINVIKEAHDILGRVELRQGLWDYRLTGIHFVHRWDPETTREYLAAAVNAAPNLAREVIVANKLLDEIVNTVRAVTGNNKVDRHTVVNSMLEKFTELKDLKTQASLSNPDEKSDVKADPPATLAYITAATAAIPINDPILLAQADEVIVLETKTTDYAKGYGGYTARMFGNTWCETCNREYLAAAANLAPKLAKALKNVSKDFDEISHVVTGLVDPAFKGKWPLAIAELKQRLVDCTELGKQVAALEQVCADKDKEANELFGTIAELRETCDNVNKEIAKGQERIACLEAVVDEQHHAMANIYRAVYAFGKNAKDEDVPRDHIFLSNKLISLYGSLTKRINDLEDKLATKNMTLVDIAKTLEDDSIFSDKAKNIIDVTKLTLERGPVFIGNGAAIKGLEALSLIPMIKESLTKLSKFWDKYYDYAVVSGYSDETIKGHLNVCPGQLLGIDIAYLDCLKANIALKELDKVGVLAFLAAK